MISPIREIEEKRNQIAKLRADLYLFYCKPILTFKCKNGKQIPKGTTIYELITKIGITPVIEHVWTDKKKEWEYNELGELDKYLHGKIIEYHEKNTSYRG